MLRRRQAFWIFLTLLGCETAPDQVPMSAAPVPMTENPAPQPETTPPPPDPPLPPADSAVKPSSEEVGSRQFWVNPAREVARSATRLQNTKPKEAGWLKKLAAQATAVWWTHRTRDPEAEASRLAQAVAGSSQYLVAVIQALPKRDCMAYETPGLDPEAYRGFIQSLKRGMGETAIYWILEPEALLLTACSKPEEHEARVRLIAETVLVLKTNPKAQVYLDIGYPGWLSVDDAVQRLLQAGVMAADGFALNVGHYQWTEDCLAYGQSISQKIGGKSFVIDTSRNGKGPGARGNWCNPKNRAIGELPMAPTGIKGLDAYLWLKEPGVSDGSCNGGPAAGQWSEAKAIELMRNAEQTEH